MTRWALNSRRQSDKLQRRRSLLVLTWAASVRHTDNVCQTDRKTDRWGADFKENACALQLAPISCWDIALCSQELGHCASRTGSHQSVSFTRQLRVCRTLQFYVHKNNKLPSDAVLCTEYTVYIAHNKQQDAQRYSSTQQTTRCAVVT